MSVTVNKFDFDQYPDNATTSVDEGFIIKTSISDIATESNSQTFAGVSLKFCLFIPRIADACTGPIFCMAKVKFSQNVPVTNNGVFTWNKNFDMQAYQNEFGLSDTGLFFNFQPYVFFDQAGTVTGLLGSVNLWWQMTGTDAQFKLALPRAAREIFPCSSYGLILKSWHPLGFPLGIVNDGPLYRFDIKTGDLKEGYSLCVASDADLPSRVKQMYPDSWVTP